MKSLRVPGKIDKKARLILDESLDVIRPQRVEVDIIFLDDKLGDYRVPTKDDILEGIREGFHDCLTGNTAPISELWDDIMIQTTAEIDAAGQISLDRLPSETKPQYVDVAIWFDRISKSPAQASEDLHQDKLEAATQELTVSQE